LIILTKMFIRYYLPCVMFLAIDRVHTPTYMWRGLLLRDCHKRLTPVIAQTRGVARALFT
jgi:hypothetical protein